MGDKRRYVVVIILTLWSELQAAHFRGGTISWKSLGGRKVQFDFNLGWSYGNGPGCTQAKIGQLVTGMSSDYWTCSKGCPGKPNLSSVNYICANANKKENWEQGQKSFVYTFPSDGPFEVSFTGGNWISLSNGKGGSNWKVATTFTLGKRSDTNDVNSSPVSLSKPMYYSQYSCDIQLRIPIVDADGDNIRCRWATGNECVSVCNALPGAVLDEKTCTINFKTNGTMGFQTNGVYAVALIIEDFPRIPITVGTAKKTPSDALSSIALQFLITTPQSAGRCDKPRFVSPSPKENEVFTYEEGDIVVVDLFADNGNDTSVKVTSIATSGVIAMRSSPITPEKNRTNTFMTTLTWNTGPKDLGNHLVCSSVTNANGISGEDRCFTVTIVLKGCGSNPCQNGAKCKSSKGSYTCICRPGFMGNNCEINIDDCVTNPCQNGGTCVDSINMFTCNCVAGYTGTLCQTDIDECQPSPCENGGFCTDGINQYTCACVPGFTGHNCSINIDECQPDPCLNNATCIDGINKYTCNCLTGFRGHRCETNIDDCVTNPCQNGGTCVDSINMFTCNCVAGYTGTLCQTDIDECQPNPCENGGNCSDGINQYTCACVPGFTGHNCSINIDECQPDPCLNNATCIDGINKYTCNCLIGFTGRRCETNIDDCVTNPCQNGGTCVDSINMFSCNCVAGYTGTLCQTDIDECQPNPCENGGNCIDGINQYTCACVPGFTGHNCSINIDECQTDPCLNNATCIDGINKYTCNCLTGFTGRRCETNIDDCVTKPCKNGGTCVDSINMFTCNCVAGYTGTLCQTDIDECQPDPCLNKATCIDGINKYTCNCLTGFTGRRCETNIDDCTPNLCSSGATCIDGINSYMCACPPGFTGINCKTGYNYCMPNPCKHGGTCIHGIQGPTCKCPVGWTGTTCNMLNTNPTTPSVTTTTTTSVTNLPALVYTTMSPSIPSRSSHPAAVPSTDTSRTTTPSVSSPIGTAMVKYPLTYDKCQCLFCPMTPRDGGMSPTNRRVLVFFYFFTLGMALSVVSYCLFPRCVSLCVKDDTSRYTSSVSGGSTPGDSTGRSPSINSPSSPKDTDRLFFRRAL